jgi:hypothetical protein
MWGHMGQLDLLLPLVMNGKRVNVPWGGAECIASLSNITYHVTDRPDLISAVALIGSTWAGAGCERTVPL